MVVSQDTPAFLYSLSNALVLRGISIEGVRIQTEQGILTDEIDVLDSRGKKIVEQERIDQLKLSVLLTKQFTYFLGKAPDPYVALARFEHMTDDVLRRPEHGEWLDLFSDPKALNVLARVLGASDYIWEDFIRSQYEAFLPMIEGRLNQQGNKLFRTKEDMARELREQIDNCATFKEKRQVLNAFKDKEIFRIDLDHIIRSGADLKALSRPLTELAQLVVGESVDIVYAELCQKHGVPRTVGRLPAKFAVFGLGKLGGEALGYASDIELLFVYSDSGQTDGVTAIENAEFFDKLVEETARFIEAKQEGIFRVDLRLRPYGESGHKACSLESFCQYYAPYGEYQ
jgi:glutamate-ammonia-ligase adenylyltransferase